jgi:hypothetical protein
MYNQFLANSQVDNSERERERPIPIGKAISVLAIHPSTENGNDLYPYCLEISTKCDKSGFLAF